jgi:hypothetical protein
MRRHHRRNFGPDLSTAFLGKQHVHNAGEAVVWAAALGSSCAARAALLEKPLAPHGGVRSAICRIAESSKAKFNFDDATATKFLMHPLFSGCINWPRLEKGKGKKRAASVLAASVDTAVDLGDEEGGKPPDKRTNSSLLEEAVCAMGALAGDPRANAQYMEVHEEDVARRETSLFCARIQLRRARVNRIFKNFTRSDLRSCHVFSLPGAVVQWLSQSLHLRSCTPKVSSAHLPKAFVYPLHLPFQLSPRAQVIHDAA